MPSFRSSSFAVLLIPLLVAPVAAQHELAVDDTIGVMDNVGLQPDGPGAFVGVGPGYRARFTALGMSFVPALGSAAAEEQVFSLAPVAVCRGATSVTAVACAHPPHVDAMQVVYERAPGMRERFDLRTDGVELSWQLDREPAGTGDLVLRYAVDTSLPVSAAAADGTLGFMWPGVGGVSVGGVTGVAADGATCTGTLRWLDGVLEMSLPDAFVREAAYPIVVDPLIGTSVVVSSTLQLDPEVAFDASTGRWMVVGLVYMAANSADVRAQRVDENGNLFGSLTLVAAGVDAGAPRIANLGTRDRFGVVWRQQDGSGVTIRFAALPAGSGGVTHTFAVATSFTEDLKSPDVGADTNAPIGSPRGFVVVYEDDGLDAIRQRRIYFSANDTLIAPTASSVFTDSFVTTYDQPAISRAGASPMDLLVVAHRFSQLTGNHSVSAALVASDSATVGPTTILGSSSDTLSVPDVDGWAGRWVAAWRRSVNLVALDFGVTQNVRLDPVAGALALGASGSVSSGGFGSILEIPTVAYTPGRTWLGYYKSQAGNGYLYVDALDTGTCQSCNDGFFTGSFSMQKRIPVATGVSGGDPTFERALAVFANGLDVRAQLLVNHGTAGTYANLGGGCGTPTPQVFSHEPGIGSSGLVCSVTGLPPSALTTIFNFAPPGAGLSCGACDWTPFVVTIAPPIVAGGASVRFPIPCLASSIGNQFEMQWTTLDLAQSPCPTFPGVVLSDRVLMTIGN